MRKWLPVLAMAAASMASAQERIVPLVEAEKSFARYAAENNTRDAFLKFMDSNAVVFENGAVLPARATWLAKKPSSGKLIWEPAFAVVSTAGDLGVTTGPWEFRATATDTASAMGIFTTLWSRKPSGEWKWLLDIGVSHNLKSPKTANVASIELNHIERSTYDAQRYMLAAEQQFINGFAASGKDTYAAVADNDIYLVNPGHLPVSGKASLESALVNMSGGIVFQPVNSGVSKDGDMGYVYGYATEAGNKGNYLRVWRRVGRKWTLLLQTLTI